MKADQLNEFDKKDFQDNEAHNLHSENAVEIAKRMGMKTIILTGKTGGLLSNIADIEIRAPHSEFADRAQEIHIKVIHALIDGIEKALKLS